MDILNDSQNVSVANNVDKEAIAVRLEHAVLAIQEILPLVTGASELLNNLDCT